MGFMGVFSFPHAHPVTLLESIKGARQVLIVQHGNQLSGTAVEPCSGSTDKPMGRGTEVPMKRLMICAFAAVGLLAAATVLLRSPPTELFASTAAMPSLQELHTAASVNKLPIQGFEYI